MEDIIRLSRIDEGAADFPKEPDGPCLPLPWKPRRGLRVPAANKGVTITVEGTHARLVGILPILRELVYNLCDNAVKYNRPGGRVAVSVTEAKDEIVLKVEDTGIGIPTEHQNRVFERFYRVDKNHSRESGGRVSDFRSSNTRQDSIAPRIELQANRTKNGHNGQNSRNNRGLS